MVRLQIFLREARRRLPHGCDITSAPRTAALRRIVTGFDADGCSTIVADAPPQAKLEFFPGAGLFEIWREGASDAASAPVQLLPAEGGATFRWFTVLPSAPDQRPEELASFYDDAFAAMSDGTIRPDTSLHPGMHRTATLDFIIVIEGQVRLIVDRGTCDLGPGDAVVQRATNHAWVCIGPRPALLAAVLLDRRT